MGEEVDERWEILREKVQREDKESGRNDWSAIEKAAFAQDELTDGTRGGGSVNLAGFDLNLSNCGLDTDDVETLVNRTMAPEGTCVRSLVLGNNPDIGDEGAELLAAALSGNSVLETLHLFNCGLSDTGGGALCGAMRDHMKIKTISLHKNPELSPEMEQHMRDAVAFKPQVVVKSARKR